MNFTYFPYTGLSLWCAFFYTFPMHANLIVYPPPPPPSLTYETDIIINTVLVLMIHDITSKKMN